MEATAQTQPIEALVAAVRAAFAVDAASLAALAEADLIALLQGAEALGAVIDGARVLAAGEVAARSSAGAEGLNGRLGCRSASEVIERATGVAAQTARGRMRAAAPLRAEWSLGGELLPGAFPETRRAVECGEMGVDAAAAIVGELAPLRERGVDVGRLALAEQQIVAAATGRADVVGEGADATRPSADEVRIVARAWALHLDPDGALSDAEPAARRREFTMGRVRDGLVRVAGGLLPEVAAQLQRLLDAYLNPKVLDGPRFSDDADTVADVDHRTPAQRRHDALAGVLAVAASHADMPQLGGAAPTLVVMVASDQLGDANGIAFVATAEGDLPVPSAVAAHTGCAGAVQRIAHDGAGRILELGLPQRIFSAHQRRAIAARDGECIIPGCHVPAAWCEVHHVREHARGGLTHTDNGVLLCWHHHRTIETGGWQVQMRDGVPWVRPPGWTDPHRTWHPVAGALRRRFDRLRT